MASNRDAGDQGATRLTGAQPPCGLRERAVEREVSLAPLLPESAGKDLLLMSLRASNCSMMCVDRRGVVSQSQNPVTAFCADKIIINHLVRP